MKKLLLLLLLSAFLFVYSPLTYSANALMPFYDLQPKDVVLRSEFSTSYGSSSPERKHNIELCAKTLDNVFIDVGGEFSFNKTVGVRNEKKGYKKAKIILDGKFTDGVGGGVCQVSTTLYNALLLADLKITEFHAHSLPVSYIEPSFDAMVNSGSADLRFINNTKNPVYLRTYTDGKTLKFCVFGEKLKYKIGRKSVVTEEIPFDFETVLDIKGEYGLFKGEKKIVSYGKNGYKSTGYTVKELNGKKIGEKIIRKDKYNALKGIIIEGVLEETNTEEEIN